MVDRQVPVQVLPALALLVLGVAWLLLGAAVWRWVGGGLAVAAVLLGLETARAGVMVLDEEGVRHPGERTIEWSEVEGLRVVSRRRGRAAEVVVAGRDRLLFGERWWGLRDRSFEAQVDWCGQRVPALPVPAVPAGPAAPAGPAGHRGSVPAPRHALPPEPRPRRPLWSRGRDGLGEHGLHD